MMPLPAHRGCEKAAHDVGAVPYTGGKSIAARGCRAFCPLSRWRMSVPAAAGALNTAAVIYYKVNSAPGPVGVAQEALQTALNGFLWGFKAYFASDIW